MSKIKLIRITTIPLSLDKLLTGQLYFMKAKGFHTTAVSAYGKEIEAIKEREQCDFRIIKMTRFITPVQDLLSLFKMISLLKKEKPQIVHTHTPKAGLIGMLAAWFCKVPVRLHTVAGLPLMETKGFKKKVLVWVEKITYGSSHYVYPNSLELKKYILQNKFTSPNKLKVLGNGSSNGIDTDHFKKTQTVLSEAEELKNKYQLSSPDLVFIFIGRIVKDKGINELVESFHQLNKKYLHLKLLLAGDFEDDLDPVSLNTKQIINSNNNIICTGFVNDVRPYLAASDVLAFPSYREGFPNVPLQAGCMELPMIVTDINGCNEIVQDGINGLVIPVKNTTALQSAMERMITDEIFRKECASTSRQIIVENYSRGTIWNALLKEYETLLHMKGINFTHVPEITETIT
jgi:glycosyltransferase involved in cell wall biosynthesis